MKMLMKAVIAAAILLMFVPAVSMAADPTAVAVVDVQKLLKDSKAGMNVQQQLEAHKTKFLTEIAQQEQKLREDEKALSEQRSSLQADEFAKKAKAFESELTESRRIAQERKKALEDAASKSMGKLRDEILKIVQQIADEKGYGLVINRQNVIISSKGMDITEETLARLDKAVSKIALEIADK
ncbi:MAG: OmpH family outer membrane protein [Alphaproteobacteria bacterium PRO2]|nr:OmpH family outer membrane protein [Alphaproteobacteria bacterium PRO2]